MSDMSMINQTYDSQLIYYGNVLNLYIKCKFSYEPGEVISFYTTKDNGGFSTKKLLHAKIKDGYYYFEYPVNAKGFRFDTGVFSSIQVDFEEIIVNKKSFYDIFRLSNKELFNLMLLTFFIYGMVLFTLENNYLNLLSKIFNTKKTKP